MTERVVNLLEAVEVEKGDGELSIIATRFADTLIEQFAKHAAVG
jgi:hypothetical protein